jgi:hypothetical protein
VSGSYLNPPLLGMTLNNNVLKNIGGEITDGILLNGDAQKIKVITGGEITCPLTNIAAGSAAGFSIFYSSITAQLRIHFFKSRPFWLL